MIGWTVVTRRSAPQSGGFDRKCFFVTGQGLFTSADAPSATALIAPFALAQLALPRMTSAEPESKAGVRRWPNSASHVLERRVATAMMTGPLPLGGLSTMSSEAGERLGRVGE